MDSLHASDLRLLAGAVLVLVGIASSLLARRFGAPLLLVFLVIGMLLGEDGPGGIAFSNYAFTYTLGSLALAIILFDGGLRTRLDKVRGAVAPSLLLATVGVVLTAGLTALAVHWLLGLAPLPSLLMGAIVASTDAAAVFFLLKAGGLHLGRRVGATLELESGSNDPVAVLMVVVITGTLVLGAGEAGTDALGIARTLGLQGVLGLALGVAGGLGMGAAINRLTLPSGLHPLLTVAGAVALFAFTNLLGGSGLLAVYVAGIVMGNRPLRAQANVLAVQDAATWLAQLVMFLVLGLLVTPSRLLEVLWPALGVAAFLMFVARPVSVALCLAPFGYGKREIGFVAWVGLRGAVAIFLASIPMLVALPDAEVYFNVAFVVVIASLVVQGWTLGPAAHWLKVALPRSDPATRRIELDLPGQIEVEMVGYEVAEGSAILRGAPLPGWARPAMVVRGGGISTAIEIHALAPGDYAYFLAPPGNVYRLDWLFAPPDEAREAERAMFGAFTLPGDVPLGELAAFYDLPIPKRYAAHSADALFAERFDGHPQIGDRLDLGDATLVVRALADERVQSVGLKFGGMGTRVFGHEAARVAPGPLARWRARREARRQRRDDGR